MAEWREHFLRNGSEKVPTQGNIGSRFCCSHLQLIHVIERLSKSRTSIAMVAEGAFVCKLL